MRPQGLTFRCGVCAINWPYHQRFTTCPQCGDACRALRLPTEDVEDILTMAAADELMGGRGLHAPAKRQPRKGRHPTADELARLHAALDRWAEEVPAWLKR
ncbi:MAG: hypothetical protein ACXVHB_06005 [Solirubrobacteraceae bacterium]